ncbi:MAG: hypothetical protein ACXV5R_08520 [Candidatus Angelobacter sp.]
MYICTFPCMQSLKILGVAIVLVTLGLPLSAQNGQQHSNVPQANLRLNVNVVPAVGPHHHHKNKDRDQNEGVVSYDLNPEREELSVTEEVRPMLADSGNNAVRQEQVRIITVVPK